jgi:hypothetical protein
MQIFASSPDPVQSAENLDDLRYRKMILESGQLMTCALIIHGAETCVKVNKRWLSNRLAKWTAASDSNYRWLLVHYCALLDEFRLRSEKDHKWEQYRQFFTWQANCIPEGDQTPFINFCGDGLKDSHQNIHNLYKVCLTRKWKADVHTPKWTKRNPPDWLTAKELSVILRCR